MAWAFLQSVATWPVKKRNLLAGLVGVAVQGASTLVPVPGVALVGRILGEVAKHGVKRLLDPNQEIPDLKAIGQEFLPPELEQLSEYLGDLASKNDDLIAQMEDLLGPVLERQDEVVDAVKKLLGERDDLKERFKAFEKQATKQLERIEANTLDIQETLNMLGQLHLHNADEVRQLLLLILGRLDQYGMRHGVVKPDDSLSIRGDLEKNWSRRYYCASASCRSKTSTRCRRCSTALAN